MRLSARLALGFVFLAVPARATDWSQPEVGCVEEVIFREAPAPCLDLTRVADPRTDLPELSPDEREFWVKRHPAGLQICRAREILRREAAQPGSMNPAAVQVGFMRVLGAEDTDGKVEAIYRAAEEREMPPQVLLGALTQESLLADLGISDDGGNFSCGIAQANLREWCEWAEEEPVARRREMGWPVDEIARYKERHGLSGICRPELVAPSLVKPFHQLARRKLGHLPEYRLRPDHFEGIRPEQVVSSFPAGPPELQALRFKLVQAFARSCSDWRYGIPAKGKALRLLFDRHVPPALKQVQRYAGGATFGRACRHPHPASAWPLHTGWLIADAAYNAGPQIVDAIAWYLRLDARRYGSVETWRGFAPTDLVEAIHGAGRYDPATDRMHFETRDGRPASYAWFKLCVAQRHMARMVQHVTLPGYTLARPLEGPEGCQKSVFDSSGKLVRTGVPAERRRSSGRKDPGKDS